jgi:hypothetical protein
MPKRVLIFIAAAVIGVAACSNNSNSSSVTPTPVPTVTGNANQTTATVLVTIYQTPQALIPVEISTPTSTASPGPRPGKTFRTEETNPFGVAVFHHLKPGKTYCWVAKFKTPIGNTSACSANWQTSGNIPLGT